MYTGNDELTGGAEQALEWVDASTIAVEEKAGLRRFVERFADRTFYRDDEATLDEWGAEALVIYPRSVTDYRRVLAFVEPEAEVVAVFEAGTPAHQDDPELPSREYYIGLFGYSGAEDLMPRLVTERHRLLPVAYVPDTGESTLGVLGDDPTVYEYNVEDLLEVLRSGAPIEEGLQRAFDSYAAMLAAVTSIRVIDF
ncbi:hypothetical protein IHN32_01740 [Deinococcus sp. 14RED07]|uniref:hypothetical protein n=1 Tax=Deinococcus sp. 14RED07 TaxID=2745874 RepID=UPI001E3B5806|nr:hypothetical protein [Deinococcus sp. 14RED07]MCD0174675.1 hypothetical protein [Deinococcus sp. 14RED07]